jgi:hypothetical protein
MKTLLFLSTFSLGYLASLSLVSCTANSTSTSTPPASPGDDGTDADAGPVTAPPIDTGPWREASVPSEVHGLACPSDALTFAATSKGLFQYRGSGFEKVADGDFAAVHLASATNGYAVGAGVMVELRGSEWSAIGVPQQATLRAVFADATGAWIGGDGLELFSHDNLPAKPKAIFVDKDNLTVPTERMLGDTNTIGAVGALTGASDAILASGSDLLSLWNGSQWADVNGVSMPGGYRSSALIDGFVFVTDGRTIFAVEAGAAEAEPSRVWDLDQGSTSELRMLLATPKRGMLAIGDHGTILGRPYSGSVTPVDGPGDVSLTAGCVTSDGHVWVAAGQRAFRRSDAL